MSNTVIIPGAIRGRECGRGIYEQKLEVHSSPFANTITTVQKDNVIVTGIAVNALKELTRPVSHCIEASYGHGTTIRKDTGIPRRQLVLKDARIRRLTPKECWRLMGFSDGDYAKAKNVLNDRFYGGSDRSDSQLYKQAGNSIVVNVLEGIMQNLQCAMPYLFKDVKVGSFFSGIGAFEKALSRLKKRPPG